MRRMANIGLVEGLALPAIDGSGVAMLEAVKLARLGVLADGKLTLCGLSALRRVESRTVDARLGAARVNLGDGADAAIGEARRSSRPAVLPLPVN